MALVTRTLANTGEPLYGPGGAALAEVDITFTLVTDSGRPTDAWDATTNERVAGSKTATTDASGLFSVGLWPNSRGNITTKYLCHVDYPGVRDFYAAMPAGESTLSWADFMASGVALAAAAQTVATLTAAATAGAGARDFVTDATVTTFASVVVGGGANAVPIFSDGTDWRIG